MHSLQKLYDTYKDKGLVILSRPCNQFNKQEPKGNPEILAHYTEKYKVTFPILEKGDVNGSKAPLWYQFVKQKCPETGVLYTRRIAWNFTKFLIDKKGLPRHRFGLKKTRSHMDEKVQELLNE